MERDEEKQSDTEQKELPPTFNFTQKALKKVELVAKECKYAKVVDNLEGTFTNAIEEARKGNRNAAWPPLQLCLGSNSSKLLIVTLDTITKMCAHGIFQDGCYDDPPPVTGPPAEQRNSFTEGEESPPASQVSQTFAEDIVTTMCSCKTEDEAVRLQLIRVILTAVTCACLEAHESYLLKSVGTLFSVYLVTQSAVNRSTAKASLQQLLSYIFARMELAQIDLNGSSGTPSGKEGGASRPPAVGSGKVGEVEGWQRCSSSSFPSSLPQFHYNAEDSWLSSFTCPDSMYMPVFNALQLENSVIHPPVSPSPREHIWARLMKPTGHFPTVHHKDAYLIFHALCKASSKNVVLSRPRSSTSSITDEGQRDGGISNVDAKLARKMLSLELLLGLIERSGLAFQTSDRFVAAVPSMLCGSILKNCASNETPVVELSLRIFLALCKDFRKCLKAEIEVFITKIFLKILLSPLSPYEHKALVLDLVCTLCSSTQILIEVFINYDCEPEAVNLYAQIIESVSKIAKGPGIGMGVRESSGVSSVSPSFREETYNLQNLALDTLVKILTSLLYALGETTTPNHKIEPIAAGDSNGGNEDSNDEGSYEETDELDAVIQVEEQQQQQPFNGTMNGLSHHSTSVITLPSRSHTKIMHAPDSKKSMDDEISSRLWKFNVNPVEEIESLQACGALGMTPADVARFLHSWSGKLDKTAIGDYLCFENGSSKGDDDGFNALVLQEYVDQMDFKGHDIDDATRIYFCGFRLSGEDKIEWVMKKFVERYCLQNPTVFPSEERAFVLVSAIVFLSINLQNSVKKHRWAVERFINENKVKEEEGGEQRRLGGGGGTVDDEISYLRDMFSRMKKDPIMVVAHSSRTSTSVIHAYDRKKKMDELLSNGILRFNLSSAKGVDRLQACGAVGKTPADVARFLHSWSEKLDKAAIGDYLSHEKEYKGGFNVLVLHEYVDQIIFSDLRFDDAIRYYLSGFRLPGEAQKIDRMMEKFAEQYCLQNPAVFPSADTAFILAFSIIMLNTDLHNPAIKEERRMTVEGFIGNNRGIGDGNNLDEVFLRDIFNSIKSNPIRLKEDDEIREQLVVGNNSSPYGLGLGLGLVYGLTGMTSTADRAKRETAYNKERVDMLRSSQALFRMRRQEKLYATEKDSSANSLSASDTSTSGRMFHERGGGLSSVQEDGERNNDNSNKFMVSEMALSEADALAYVRAMFDVAWWPMLGAFSQVLEECCGQSNGELFSPEGIGGMMVQHCLGGCRLGLRLSARCIGGGSFLTSMPNVDGSGGSGPHPLVNNISREAFMNTVGKFTLLEGTYNSIREMHPHHLRCIHTLLIIAREDGEYLEESWGCVLRLLSQLARLLILAEGLASDGEFFGPPSRNSSMTERRGSENTFKRTTSRAKTKAARWQMSNVALIQAEISMELIDRIFANSINLSTSGIHYLVNHLCFMSQLELSPESSVVLPIVKEGGDNNNSAIQAPRIFSLQKLVEVADFNMDVRGRLVWASIWETLSGHFSEIGAHENPQLAMYAIDSLRQLAVKFMVKEELRDFNFQRVVLRPFEAITATSSCTEEHVIFILHCIEQLVQARGKSIRSGWKSVLSVLSTAIRGWPLTTAKLAWGILQNIVEHEFSALSCDFLDVTKCLLSLLRREDSEELSLLAVKSLCSCAGFLGRGEGKGRNEVHHENENGMTNLSILTPPPHPHLYDRANSYNQNTSTTRYKKLEVSNNNLAEDSEESHLCLWLWWPLLFGLSESVEDPRKELRHACLEALTSTLQKYGSLFSTQTWLLLLKAVLFPMFENTATDLVEQPSSYFPTDDTLPPSSSAEPSPADDDNTEAVAASHIAEAYSSSWTAVTAPLALETCCRLLVAHPSRLFPLFVEILGVYKRCICQEREGLARIGVQGLISLIKELEKKCPNAVVERDEGQVTKTVWDCITDFLCDIMRCNFPTDFLENVITTCPPSSSPQVLSWEELKDVIVAPKSPRGLMTMMVVSQQLVCAVRDMLLMFARKGRSTFISLLGIHNVKCLMTIISESTAVYRSFNDCLPLRVSLAQDNFMLHLNGTKKKGYSSTANQEYNSWIAEVQVAVALGFGIDFENGEKIKDPPNLEVAYNELIRIFTDIVSCYNRRQEILGSFGEIKDDDEKDNEVVHALIMHENMDSMTTAVVQVLKMLQYLSYDQFRENVSCIYSTLVKLIRSDSILVRDAVQEIMSNRLQAFIQEIPTVIFSRPPPHQPVIQ